MNVAEANATNRVVRYLLHLATGNGDAPDAHQLNEVRGAAAFLADRASARLMVGVGGAAVLEALPEYCADKLVEDDGTVRFCFRPAGHSDDSSDGRDWHDDVAVVWPVEPEAGGRRG